MRTASAWLLCLCACSATPPVPSAPRSGTPIPAASTTSPPNWKERIEQPYLYREHRGDYRDIPALISGVLRDADALGVERHGEPFVLFYDDPGNVPLAELRARVCVPTIARPTSSDGFRFDVLPREMVAYARVPGGAPEAAQGYPELLAYMRTLGWHAGAPIREVYHGFTADGSHAAEQVTEVQIPRAEAPR